MIDVTEILNLRISLFLRVQAKLPRPITLYEALNAIRIGTYEEEILKIRRIYQSGTAQDLRAKKIQLPAYVFAGLSGGSRYKFDVSRYTSLMIVDIDHSTNLEYVRTVLQSDPYIVSLWTSPSGTGLKALFYVEYEKTIKPADIWIMHEHCAFPQIKQYLFSTYGIQIDETGRDITRMCFVSYDPQIHLKKQFEPFGVKITLNAKTKYLIRTKYNYGTAGRRQAINEMKQWSEKHSFDNDISD